MRKIIIIAIVCVITIGVFYRIKNDTNVDDINLLVEGRVHNLYPNNILKIYDDGKIEKQGEVKEITEEELKQLEKLIKKAKYDRKIIGKENPPHGFAAYALYCYYKNEKLVLYDADGYEYTQASLNAKEYIMKLNEKYFYN